MPLPFPTNPRVLAVALAPKRFLLHVAVFGDLPVAVAASTGSLPDVATTEGKEAVAAYVFVFINFARVIVPLRIALALALAPWCERNIIEKFFPAKVPDECEV